LGNIGRKTGLKIGQHWEKDRFEDWTTLGERQVCRLGNIGRKTVLKIGQHWEKDRFEDTEVVYRKKECNCQKK